MISSTLYFFLIQSNYHFDVTTNALFNQRIPSSLALQHTPSQRLGKMNFIATFFFFRKVGTKVRAEGMNSENDYLSSAGFETRKFIV